MSKSNTTENDILLYIFNATAMPAYGASGGTILYAVLHTADPGEAGVATTSEATYGSYARVAINRNNTGFTVSGNTASNAAAVTFPQCSSGTNTVTHISITTASSGGSQILYSGALASPLAVSTNSTPNFAIGQLAFIED